MERDAASLAALDHYLAAADLIPELQHDRTIRG